jgi:hypothetical protein
MLEWIGQYYPRRDRRQGRDSFPMDSEYSEPRYDMVYIQADNAIRRWYDHYEGQVISESQVWANETSINTQCFCVPEFISSRSKQHRV